MRRRHLIPSAVLVTVSGLGARGYFSHADAFLSTKSADSDVSSALTDKQDKAHFDFKSAGIISDYRRCGWTRLQLNKAEPGIGESISISNAKSSRLMWSLLKGWKPLPVRAWFKTVSRQSKLLSGIQGAMSS